MSLESWDGNLESEDVFLKVRRYKENSLVDILGRGHFLRWEFLAKIGKLARFSDVRVFLENQ